MYHLLAQLRAASLAARERLTDSTISTRVKAGQFQVVRVTFPNGRASSQVEPVSAWLDLPAVVDFLNAMA